MKKEQLFKLLNTGKRDHTGIKKGKKHTFKCILMKYTGRSIVSTFIQKYTSLKDDLTLVFKPIKNFTKKQLKGNDTTTFNESAGHKEVPAKSVTHNDTFDNWFDVDGNTKEPSKRITLKKEDGRVVGLDDYKNDIIW